MEVEAGGHVRSHGGEEAVLSGDWRGGTPRLGEEHATIRVSAPLPVEKKPRHSVQTQERNDKNGPGWVLGSVVRIWVPS